MGRSFWWCFPKWVQLSVNVCLTVLCLRSRRQDHSFCHITAQQRTPCCFHYPRESGTTALNVPVLSLGGLSCTVTVNGEGSDPCECGNVNGSGAGRIRRDDPPLLTNKGLQAARALNGTQPASSNRCYILRFTAGSHRPTVAAAIVGSFTC